jgi:hypothetical protein
MKKALLRDASIPLAFILGIIAFFALVPWESITLNDFIAYMASLSTVIMVLVYIVTTSRQLNAMKDQLSEMQTTRNLQNQPLLLPECTETKIIAPNFWGSPHDSFKEMHLEYPISFKGRIKNVGNTPAVNVSVFSSVKCLETRGSKLSGRPLCKEDRTITKEESISASRSMEIECVSCGKEDSVEVKFKFSDDHALLESMLSQQLTFQLLEMTILYKNLLGGCFRTEATYEIRCSQKGDEGIKSYLKAIRDAKIDYGKDLAEYKRIMAEGKGRRPKEAEEISKRLRQQFPIKYQLKNISLTLRLDSSLFSVKPISQEDYARVLKTMNESHTI